MSSLPCPGGEPVVPTHVAIIMDGNGRWAKSRGLPRTAGHKRGAEAVKTAVEAAARLGVGYLTLFGFSSENWRRPAEEVRDLLNLLQFYLRHESSYLKENGVRFRVIGNRDAIDEKINALIDRTEATTAQNTRLTLLFALSYGAREEIATAARRAARDIVDGVLATSDLTEERFERYLYTAGVPDPDLLIRTSGEQRLSNFLLWQAAYAELVFLDTLWPDFSRSDFEGAVAAFQRRERRYGASSA